MIHKKKGLESEFTIIANSMAQNMALSWEARGMLGYFLSLPENWTIRIETLITEDCGKTKIYRILKELIKKGYVSHERQHNPETQQFEWQPYEVYALPEMNPYYKKETEPFSVLPEMGQLDMGKPFMANPPLQRNSTTKQESNKETTLADNKTLSNDSAQQSTFATEDTVVIGKEEQPSLQSKKASSVTTKTAGKRNEAKAPSETQLAQRAKAKARVNAIAVPLGITTLTSTDEGNLAQIANQLIGKDNTGIPEEKLEDFVKWVINQAKNTGGWTVTPRSLLNNGRPSQYMTLLKQQETPKQNKQPNPVMQELYAKRQAEKALFAELDKKD